MMNTDLFKKVTDLSVTDYFTTCVPLSERQEDQAYRQELVLRFFAQADFQGSDSQLRQEYGEYVTSWMRGAAEREVKGELVVDPGLFTDCFSLLQEALGDDSFRRWDPDRGTHLGPFSIACFEFVTSGLAANVHRWQSRKDELRDRVRAVWSAAAFRENSGTGVSPRRRVPRLVLGAREFFAEG